MADEKTDGDKAVDIDRFTVKETREAVKSSLWKEDVYCNDHTAVWGSWYDPTDNCWGYACCKIKQHGKTCKLAEDAARREAEELSEAAEDMHGSSDSESADDLNSAGRKRFKAEDKFDWSNPPMEFQLRSEIEDPGQYINHFVRYFIGAWRRKQEAGFDDFADMEKKAFVNSLSEMEEALAPLVRRIESGQSLDHGELKGKQGWSMRCRETRPGMEGRAQEEKSVLGQLDEMVTHASDMEYRESMATYMRMTLGNKTWNNTIVQQVPACTMKGAREYRRNRDSLNTYDMDPVSQKYMWALRKLIQFASCIRPNSDKSKNCVL
eukprot:gnl/MRDRNA2_/MRDRNA2_122505_c0_seq1.p1 gnl/MRDRNA2_/MRDRNA2_122505_c0~~gnl/MRDRNA2_/MRDRNA2_122505_c0_seq1.p1  ORF type:complete len:369 (-),score=75.78 gnl/MRDRNA2_/MRDRNA2_122505_c0_seq1:13-978(-)